MSRARLEPLLLRYRRGLPAKARELEALASAGLYGNRALTELLHQIAGAAGFYGEHEIARRARQLEQRVSCGPEDAAAETADRNAFERLVTQLASAR